MADRKISRGEVLKGAAAVGVVGALGAPAAAFASHGRVRWDLPNVFTPCPTRGGQASAKTVDGATITMRGHGKFPNVRNHCTKDVTGRGTWEITPGTATEGCFSGCGTFRVTELLRWVPAPGEFPFTCDDVGPIEGARAGLAMMRVRYSNGWNGVLTVSCHLVGSPDCIFEGITASMGYEDFTFPEPPAPGVEGNRTIFHLI
ncbi:MAG: hypothetical protein LC808_00690 [Actinobacteria bacterium]|nr:hypothetical protein [Actinomycetota bacterium]